MTIGRLPQIIFSPNDNLGSSSPGARLSFYEAGSTTNFKAIFSDFASTPLENPVLADGVGRFPNIVLDDATSGYNVKFETSDGATIPVYTQQWFEDNVSFAGSDPLLLGDGTAADPTYSYASETNTGIFLAGSGLLAASILGNEVVQWTAQGLNVATSGESATPSLYLEGDIDTGWRQDGVNNWTFSATGQDELSLSLGLMSLPGPTAANNIFSMGAKTGFGSTQIMGGDDIAQPITGIAGATTFLDLSPVSTAVGGTQLTGFSEGDARPLVLRGFIGSNAPSTSTPAVQIRTGKSNGGTGVGALASTESAFSITDSDGTTDLFTVAGNGDLVTPGNIGVGLFNAANSGNTHVGRLDSTNAAYTNFVLKAVSSRAANSAFSLAGFYTDGDSTLQTKIGGDGNNTCEGAWTGGGADYAEYFEWIDGNPNNEDRAGVSVVLVGNKIRPATEGGTLLGVISVNPSVVGDGDIDRWKGKYLKDDFGRYILEDYSQVEWAVITGEAPATDHSYQSDKVPKGLTVPSYATVISQDEDGNNLQRRKVNPDYVEGSEYISRENRQEWSTVGLMGKLRILKGQPVAANWIKMRDVSDTVEEWFIK